MRAIKQVIVKSSQCKKIAQEIAKSKYEGKAIYKKISELGYSKENIEKYSSNLFKNKKMLELVMNETGLSEEVIKECKMGYVEENKMFTFPMIALDDSITGLPDLLR